MARQIVVEVYEYEAETPEEAERAMREAQTHYERPGFVYAASSLDTLAHPMSVEEIREHFGV